MSAAGGPSAWESRFPTFVTTSSTPSVAVSRATSAATKPKAPSVAPLNDSSVVKRAVTPTVAAGTGAAVARVRATVKPQSNHLTPMEAIHASIAAQSVAIDYSAGSIQPGSAAASPTKGLPALKEKSAPQPLVDASDDGSDVVPQPNPHREAFASLLQSHQVTQATGIHRMEAAIERLHSRLAHVPLDRRWTLIANWINRYFDDHDANILSRQMHEINQAVNAETQFRPKPCAFRTATSLMMFEQILHVLTRSKPELREVSIAVRDNILAATYMLPPRADLNETFSMLRDPRDLRLQRELIDRFYTKTYFQKLRDLQKAHTVGQIQLETVERQKERTTQLLNRVVTFWQNYCLRRVVLAWKGYTAQRRSKRQLYAEIDGKQKVVVQLQEELAAKDQRIARIAEINERAVGQLRADITSLRGMLNEERDRARSLEKERDELKTEVERLRDRVAIYEGDSDDDESSAPKKKGSFSNSAEGRTPTDRQRFVEAQSMRAKVSELTATVEQLRAQLLDYSVRSDAATKELGQVNSVVQPLAADVQRLAASASTAAGDTAWATGVASWIAAGLPQESDAARAWRESGGARPVVVSRWDLLYALHLQIPLPPCGNVATKMHKAAQDWVDSHGLQFLLGDKTQFDICSDLGVLMLCAFALQNRFPLFEQQQHHQQGAAPQSEVCGAAATLKDYFRGRAVVDHAMLKHLRSIGVIQ